MSQRRFSMVLCVALSLGLIVLACGPARSVGDDTCESDQDCARSERCEIGDDSDVGECREPDSVFGPTCDAEPECIDDETVLACDNGELKELSCPGCDGGECFGPGPSNNGQPGGGGQFRFVLLEDTTPGPFNGDTAGADVDGVCIERLGVELGCATSIEDANLLLDNNAYIDTLDALGPPDSECMKQNFTSMGGDGGYMVMGFGDVTFESGDDVVVYELSSLICENQPNWVLDPVTVSVSASSSLEDFIEIGTTASGTIVITVP